MPQLPSLEVERLIGLVRSAWAASPVGPNLGDILTPDARSDHQALVEILLADAEERTNRSLPHTLDAYRALAPNAETLRPILMHLLANENPSARAQLASELKQRYADLGEQIDLVSELCDELSDSLGLPADPASSPQSGQTIGKYRLIDRLGGGSFGEVWQALDTELDRYVALKLLYHDAARSEQVTLERALAEARAAAALSHEHIVTVHAVGRLGASEGGRFYIDSALVGDSAPTAEDPRRIAIGRSLDVVGLRGGGPSVSPREAARLMAAVCRGIAAAHARGVLHRDIKPANILLTPSGKPMVADFGLSTTGLPPRKDGEEPHLHSVSLRSESGRRIIGTPAYMSPEQAAGERPTALSDVYSLGATLRFLLSGSPPFKPSGRFSDDARWDVIAQVRETNEPQPIGGAVPDALASICDRSMARAPESRYSSAMEMAEDLEAWLTHRPTRASPPSAIGAAVLWCRRNSALALLLAVGFAAGAVGASAYIVRVGAERDRAVAAERLAESRLRESEAARLEAETSQKTAAATVEFLEGLLSSADPREQGKSVTVVDALARSGDRITETLGEQEPVEAAVRTTIGRTYRSLNSLPQAREHLDRALEIRERLLGPEHPLTLGTKREIAVLLAEESRTADAAKLLEEVVEAQRRILGPRHIDTAQSLNDLGAVRAWTRDLDGALSAYQEAAALRAGILGPEHPRTLASRNGLARVLSTQGKTEEAEKILREVLAAHDRRNKPLDMERLTVVNDLAVTLRGLNRQEEAVPLVREAFEGMEAQMPRGHLDVLIIGINLVGLLNRTGHSDEAWPLSERLRDLADEFIDEKNTFRWMTHVMVGDSLTHLKRFEEAEKELLPAYERIVAVIGKDGRTSRTAATRIVKLYEDWGRPEEAEKWKPLTVAPAPPAPPPAEAPK